MDRYEPFDLKITKLTGTEWHRDNAPALARQLITEQGKPRFSIENRMIIAFDQSRDSSVSFLRLNQSILVEALLSVAYKPYHFTHWLEEYGCWVSIVLITKYRYQQGKYYEHPIGAGMRESEKAEFETRLLQEATVKSGGLIKYNPDTKQHGYDGDLYLDRQKLTDPHREIKLIPLEPIPIFVCDYGAGSVSWPNCLPCPLYKDGDCQSRGAIIFGAIK